MKGKRMGKITVFIQPGQYPGPRDIAITRELGEDLVRRTFTPLDHPTPTADVITRELFCSETVTIRETTIKRKRAAKMISEVLTEVLLDAMGIADTEMGYPKDHA
jgi:hypothetical protein